MGSQWLQPTTWRPVVSPASRRHARAQRVHVDACVLPTLSCKIPAAPHLKQDCRSAASRPSAWFRLATPTESVWDVAAASSGGTGRGMARSGQYPATARRVRLRWRRTAPWRSTSQGWMEIAEHHMQVDASMVQARLRGGLSTVAPGWPSGSGFPANAGARVPGSRPGWATR